MKTKLFSTVFLIAILGALLSLAGSVDQVDDPGILLRAAMEKEEVDGKSPMELMLLEATAGTTIRILACGPDAEEAATSLAGLVKNRFGTEL